MEKQHTYLAVDLKSFYASCELADRGLNPLTTNLVVADSSRTEKTICLAVTPSLKRHGISGRARLFEVIQKVKEVNAQRMAKARSLGLLTKDPIWGRKASGRLPAIPGNLRQILLWSWPTSRHHQE